MGAGGRIVVSFGAGLGLLLMLLSSGCSKKESTEEKEKQTQPTLPRKAYDTARLFNGITLQTSVNTTASEGTALHLEQDPEAYTLRLELHLQVPKPASTSADLLAATPALSDLLPNLETLVQAGSPSPDYAELYDHKEKNLRENLNELQHLLPRDTLYDCQTILTLQNPDTDRRAILVQALMDVNTDGSDGDRNFTLGKSEIFFQPQTNYRWPKASKHPNPYLKAAEQQVEEIDEKLDSDSLSGTDKKHLKANLEDAQAKVVELKHWSFLTGMADPFIVLPSFMVSPGEGHPEIGDYAIVIAKGVLCPAIVGDKGPNFKIGEASLRIAQQVDSKSTADFRPVDHPKVVYLVFPGTAEKPFAAPDYNHWSDRCHALWKEFGGSDSAPWHTWTPINKPWPTPTPTPTPSPIPTSTPDQSPSDSESNSPATNQLSSPTPTPDSSPSSTSGLISGTNPAAVLSPSPLPQSANQGTATNTATPTP